MASRFKVPDSGHVPELTYVDGIRVDTLVSTLCDLGRVEQLSQLGMNGPLDASCGSDSSFRCLFGRDAIRMAMDLLDDFPLVAYATLIELARLQGVDNNPRSDEEPGRILHEHRHPDDPRAIAAATRWDFPYFGAVDTTPQWINLLAAYCANAGTVVLDAGVVDRLSRQITLRDSLVSAVEWIVGRLQDPIGGGYLWVRRSHPHGLANQVWEDSFDSYYHEDGSLLDPNCPYAPVAVQGYAYDALINAVELLSDGASPLLDLDWLRSRAAHLRDRVLAEFWQADLGTFAAAITFEPDGTLRPARVVASNAGHLLASGLLDGADVADMRERLIERMVALDMLAAAGVRTKATSGPRFLPGSYHNGSVWPMDTGVIADGLRRHGHDMVATDLEERILNSCRATQGFPEFLRGELDGSLKVNADVLDVLEDGLWHRLEQPPQTNQGWTATRVWRILRQRGAIAWEPARIK